MVPLTVAEVRRLLALRLTPDRTSRALRRHVLSWSLWRRKHQATARHCHYQRRFHSLVGHSAKTTTGTPPAHYTPDEAPDQAR